VTLEPHPWNTGFSWQGATRGRSVVSASQAAQWDRDGYFLLEGALGAPELEAVRAAIDPLEERTTAWLRDQGGSALIADAEAITFTTHLVARSDVCRSFAAGPVFAGLCADLVGPDVRLYWDQAVYKKPEPEREFPWHQDNGYAFVEPQQYLTCWVPLVDATVRNGCPWVVPGLHLGGTLRHWWTPVGFQCVEDPEGAVPVEARAGDVVVFSSLTPHRTGPNTSDSVRKAYILQYAPDGAVALRGDEGRPEPQDDPDRQFPVLRGGQPIDWCASPDV
jgi:ectoine hydroxylase-related dioxygenase (phytanoyl-CoA dioxygenase family)